MATLNPTDYFASKLAQSSSGKMQALAETSAQKAAIMKGYMGISEQDKAATEASWVGQLGLTPGEFSANRVNDVASLVSGASRLAGQVASLPVNALSSAMTSAVPEESIAAYNRIQSGQGLPTDQVDPRLVNAESLRNTGRAINDKLDLTGIVEQTNRKGLTDALGSDFQKNWDKVSSAWDDKQSSDLMATSGKVITGLAGLLVNAAEAAVTNPSAAREYVIENAPQLFIGAAGKAGQLAMSASNAGYGWDTYQKGLENYARDNQGQLPPQEDRNRMAWQSVAMVAMESAGDLKTLSSIKKSADSIKAGFKASLKNTAVAAGENVVSEGITEGTQTYLEGQVTGDKTTAQDIYTSAVIGGISGGVMAGGARGVSEMSGNTKEQATVRANKAVERAKEADAFVAAATTNDITTLVDPKHKDFNPVKALSVLAANNKMDTSTPESKAENSTKASKIVDDLETEYAKQEESYSEMSPEAVKANANLLKLATTKLAELDPADSANTAAIKRFTMLRDNAADAAEGHATTADEATALGKSLPVLAAQLEQARHLKAGMEAKTKVDPVSTAAQVDLADSVAVDGELPADTEARTAAVKHVVSQAMRSPDTVSDEVVKRLLDNTSNGLSEVQRGYLRELSASRVAENDLKAAGTAHDDVLYGSNGSNGSRPQVGINQYRERMGNAIVSGNASNAEYHLGKLTSFAEGHQEKYLAGVAAIAGFNKDGQTRYVMRTKAGWETSTSIPGAATSSQINAALKLNGGMAIKGNSRPLVDGIQKEAKVLAQAVTEMGLAYKVAFDPKAATTTKVKVTVPPAPGKTGKTGYEGQGGKPLADGTATYASYKIAKTAISDSKTQEVVKLAGGSYSIAPIVTKAEKPVVTPSKPTVVNPPKAGAPASELTLMQRATTLMAKAQKAIDEKMMPKVAEFKKLSALVNRTDEQESRLRVLKAGVFGADTMVSDFIKDTVGSAAENARILKIVGQERYDTLVKMRKMYWAADDEVAGKAAAEEKKAAEERDAEVQPGNLKALQESKQSPEGTPFNKRTNLLADSFKQKEGKKGSESFRPLVAIKDFLSHVKNGTVDIASFLANKVLTDEQSTVIKAFVAQTTAWNAITKSSLVQADSTDNSDYLHKDLMQFLISHADVDGVSVADLEENVKTAISVAAHSAVIDMAAKGATNDHATINSILNRREDSRIRTDGVEYKWFRKAVVGENTFRNSVGKKAFDALGFSLIPGAPKNLTTRLQSSLGSYVEKLLLEEGIIVRTLVPAEVMTALMNDERSQLKDKSLPHKQANFVRLARGTDNKLIDVSANMVSLTKGTGDILGKLFGVESALKQVGLEPIAVKQETAKNTKQGIPSRLKTAIAEKQAEVNRIHEDRWSIMSQISDDTLLGMAGGVDLSDKNIHKVNRLGSQAKNDGLLREFDNYKNMVNRTMMGEEGFAQKIFFEYSVWKQQRVGIATNEFNPQASKMQRYLTYKEKWEATLNSDSQDGMDNFKLRVMEGFGVKTDRQDNALTLAAFDRMFDEKAVNADGSPDKQTRRRAVALNKAIAAIQENTVELSMTPAMEANLLAGVKAGGEKFHTFDVLMAMASMRSAESFAGLDATGSQVPFKFTVRMMAEVDGVTNGPMLSHLLYGAANSVDSLFKMINKGGFFKVGENHTQYNQWRGQAGNRDLYETTTYNILGHLTQLMASKPQLAGMYANVQKFTGSLQKEDKSITSDGRNLIKTAINALVFGSRTETALSNMSEEFVASVYERIQEASAASDIDNDVETNETARTIIADINALMNPNVRLKTDMTMKELMEHEFSFAQEKAIGMAFKETLGQATEDVIKGDFHNYLEQRDAFNKTAQAGFTIYDGLRKGFREEYINGLIANKELLTDGSANPQPLHDLSAEQEAAFESLLADALPMLHSSMSKADGEIDSGLRMTSEENVMGTSGAYVGRTKFGTPLKDTAGRTSKAGSRSRAEHFGMDTRSNETVQSSPGVGMSSKAMHSFDSAIAHLTQIGREMLNVHDAGGTGLNQLKDMATAFNQNTWLELLSYSPVNEMYESYARTVGFLADLMASDQLSPIVMKSLETSLAGLSTKKNPMSVSDILEGLLVDAKAMAVRADTIKLTAMSQMASVDQYAFQGGNYMVTEDDQNAAKTALAAVLKNKLVSVELLVKVRRAVTAIEDGGSTTVATTETLGTTPPVASAFEVLFPFMSGIQVMQLLEFGSTDESKSQEERDTFRKALNEMEAGGQTINEILAGMGKVDEMGILSNLYAYKQAIPMGYWGSRAFVDGDHNAALVKVLESKATVTFADISATLREQLGSTGNKVMRPFQVTLFDRIVGLVDPKMVIRYITPLTPAAMGVGERQTNARGWYNHTGTAEAIHVLSPAFETAQVKPELLMHEILHAVLGQVIQGEQIAKETGVLTKNAKGRALYAELEVLMAKAKAVDTSGVYKDTALKDVHEFLSWGMTNVAFQATVLSKINVADVATKTLVSGAKSFVQSLVKYVFSASTTVKTEEQRNATGMASFLYTVGNLVKLVEDTAVKGQKDSLKKALSQSMSVPNSANFSTTELYDALQDGPQSSFDSSLRGLLDGIVNKLHGPFGSFKAGLMDKQAMTADEVFQKAQATGVAPFASKVMAANLAVTKQEAFVLEQVEATVREALNDTTGEGSAVYSMLSKLYLEVSGKVSPKDFHAGDWATATVAEIETATNLHAFVFTVERTDGVKTDHLSRFAALGLSHQGFNNILDVATERDTRKLSDAKTFQERLTMIFNRVLNFFNGKMTKTVAGEKANTRLTALVGQLVDIEAKKRALLAQPVGNTRLTESMEEGFKEAFDAGREKLDKFGQSDFFRNSNKSLLKATGAVVSTVAGNRVAQFMKGVSQISDEHTKGRHGFVAGIIDDIRGPTAQFEALARFATKIQGTRKAVITAASKFALGGFVNGGKGMSLKAKAAISAVYLRTGAFTLLDRFSISEIGEIATDKTMRDAAINTFLAELDSFPAFKDEYIELAKMLGYYKATGVNKHPMLLMNAGNIARLYMQPSAHLVSETQALGVTASIDMLVSLYAIEYSNSVHVAEAATVMTQELARTDNTNGVEGLMRLHQSLDKQASNRLFNGSDALMMKGYLPDITNPETSVVSAISAIAGQDLVDQGYSEGAVIHNDPSDPDQSTKRLYTLRNGGQAHLLSGSYSNVGMGTKGTTQHNGNLNMLTNNGQINAANVARITQSKHKSMRRTRNYGANLNPALVKGSFMSPVLNADGVAVNYRSTMADDTKDTLMERDNRFESILGALAGNLYDKESAPEQNAKVTQALFDDYTKDFEKNPAAYIEVGAKSADPEMRENYRLLSPENKKNIREVWGGDRMFVRRDLLDLTFGYHKLSLANVFDKDGTKRNVFEETFAWSVEHMLKLSAGVQNRDRAAKGLPLYDVDRYAKRAAVTVRRAERMWQAVVKEIKDIIVVKTGTVMLGNIASNLHLLAANGVGMRDIVKYHRIAWQGANDYQRDSEALSQLQMELSSDYVVGDKEAARKEVRRLEDALARNPVAPMIEAGLMPTIVEDLAQEEDIYSFKTEITKKTERFTNKLNPTVLAGARTAFMAHDTKLYQAFSRVTQLSDFVARYTLYQHLTTKKNPMSSEEAIQEASDSFINYDLPMHRGLQYTDDMGITTFSKYFLRIQRVIAKLVRDHPGQVAATLVMGQLVNLSSTVLDSSLLTRFGAIPLQGGPAMLPGVVPTIAPIHAALSLFK